MTVTQLRHFQRILSNSLRTQTRALGYVCSILLIFISYLQKVSNFLNTYAFQNDRETDPM